MPHNRARSVPRSAREARHVLGPRGWFILTGLFAGDIVEHHRCLWEPVFDAGKQTGRDGPMGLRGKQGSRRYPPSPAVSL